MPAGHAEPKPCRTSWWVVGLLVLAACAGGPPAPRTPEATVSAFARAIAQRRYAEAYAMMSAGYRERVSFERFEAQLSENPDETVEMGNALMHARGPAAQQATLDYDDDAHLLLRRDGDRWYIASNVVDFYDQSSPRAALRTFVRAMERKRYDVVMRLVPSADKEGVTTDRMREAWSGDGREEVERMLSNLRNHIDNPIEVVGNHATMPYGDRLRVQFLREDGAWKIEDPE